MRKIELKIRQYITLFICKLLIQKVELPDIHWKHIVPFFFFFWNKYGKQNTFIICSNYKIYTLPIYVFVCIKTDNNVLQPKRAKEYEGNHNMTCNYISMF